jgi:hypothetical protein
MKLPFRLGFAIAMTTGIALATYGAANAMPVATSMTQADAPLVQNIDWACGPGLHVNPWGRCVPNYWRRGWYGGGWRRGNYGYPAWGGGGYGWGYGGGWQRRWHEDRDWDD